MSGMEVIRRPDLEVAAALGEFVKEAVATKQTKEEWGIMGQALESNDILYSRYTRRLFMKSPDRKYYTYLDDYDEKQLVLSAMRQVNILISARRMKDVVELIKANAKMIEKPNTNCIMISDNLFWDKEEGEIVRNPTSEVFYRLFDIYEETTKIVRTPPFTEEQEKIFWERYEQVKAELQRGEEIERYEFLKTWANGSHDVYMDLHRAHAYMFLKKKPLGSYVLIGLKRNGKSTYLNLTHSIMGTKNTSMVQLHQLGDAHHTHELLPSLMNAPDEEEDKAITAQGFFKVMADHGSVMLPVMGSNQPIRLTCDFMSFFPMNHTPEWTGTGAAACMNRSLIIPFNADLSKFDKTSDNFMKETFTPDVMADYLGSVFAYAWWYHRHDFDFSDTMKTEQGVLEQDIDSCLTYYKRFTKYFDGFETFKTVYTDYQLWCQAQDVKINTRKELKFVFRAICNSKTSYRRNGISGKNPTVSVYRIPKGKQPLMNTFKSPEVGYLEDVHNKNCSIIDRLDVYYAAKGVE